VDTGEIGTERRPSHIFCQIYVNMIGKGTEQQRYRLSNLKFYVHAGAAFCRVWFPNFGAISPGGRLYSPIGE